MELDQATRTSRREALKKLAATSAAATLTATVISSRAFADGGTTGSRPTGIGGSVIITASMPTTSSVSVIADVSGVNPGACPTGDPVRREFVWEISRQPINTTIISISDSVAFGPISNPTINASQPLSVESYRVKLTVRWVCDQAPDGATAAWSCISYEWSFEHDPVDGLLLFARTGTIPVSSKCNTPPPTPPSP